MEIKQVLKDINKIEDKPLCFSLDFESHDKISSHYYDPRVLKLLEKLDTIQNSVTLGQISEKVKYSDGKWELHTTDYVPEDYPESVLLMQVLNLSEEGVKIETKYDKFIKKELHEKWKNSQVKQNDIIMSITGTIGLSVLIPKEFPEANLNQALARIVLKKEFEIDNKKIKINPEFVLLYINSQYGRLQLDRLGGSRAGQSGLSTTEIKSMKIPLLSYEEQSNIVKEVYRIKEEAKEKLKSYKECLEKIKALLGEVINLKEKDFKNFYVTKKEKVNDRLDCYFYHPEREYLHKVMEKLDIMKFEIRNGEKINIVKPLTKSKIDEVKTHLFRYVDIGNTEKDLGDIIGYEENIILNLPSRAKQLGEKADVMQPRPIGSIEGVVIIPEEYDNQLFTTGFIHIRPKNEEEAFLLWVVLKSEIIQKQMFYLQSGSIQPEITPENFKKHIVLAVPKGNYRDDVIKKASEHIKEARKLKKDYLNKLNEAKERFLDLIKL